MKRSILAAAAFATLSLAAGMAQAITPFQQDVTTAIDRGIEWLATNGGFVGSAGDATGIPMQALLEKRASGNPADPPSGYSGATATDQGRLRTAAVYIINQTSSNGAGFYAYRDGSRMFALSGYALTSGPDKAALGSAITIKAAMDMLLSRTLASQNAAGYWCYNNGGCNDSSTTQFASAGLHAARSFYTSAKSGDDGAFADPAKVLLIDAALAKTMTAYESAPYVGTGSDNAACGVLSATEHGHGYHPANEGYKPSLQQTASGVYIQLFGGADVNTPMVQSYMEWLRNRYRYTDLDSMGNSWPTNSWSYYMWSSFKGMELMRQSGVAPAFGNLTPDSLGTLPAASAPACNVRQENKDPAVVARPAVFGAGGVGYYAAESKGQYFDYASQILSIQCASGSFNGCGAPGPWDTWANQGYLLLVLQRSVGNVVEKCDVNGDGKVDRADLLLIQQNFGKHPANFNLFDANGDGIINIADLRYCQLHMTK